jgi:hypothetical protein
MKKVFAATALMAALAGAGSADAALYINQIYGGGGATGVAPLYSNDWVQLYNSGAAAIDLTGYSLQYAAATSTTTYSSSNTHNLSGSVGANSYFLIQEGRGTGLAGTATDPIYNLTLGTFAGLNMSATAGKLALFSTGYVANVSTQSALVANLVDLVGFGTTANFSLYPKMTANLSTTTAAIRTTDALGNVTFVAGTPDPNPATPTPIPAAAWLLGSGLLGLAGIKRKKS